MSSSKIVGTVFAIIFDLHSLNRYLILGLLIWVTINSLMKFIGRKSFTPKDNLGSLTLLIFTHIQLLLGVYLYIKSPLVVFSGEVMRVATLRYWTVEHSFMMLLAIVLITLGRILAKGSLQKIDDGKPPHTPHKILFFSHGVALIFIAASLLTMMRIA